MTNLGSLVSLKEQSDKEKVKESEKAERPVKRREGQGVVVRQTSPNSMNDLIQSSPYKMYSSNKRKVKAQQTPKN